MAFSKYLRRLERMHALIRRKATGTPDAFADKMGISRSSLMRALCEMKNMGAPIDYDSIRKSYYYSDEVEFHPGFKKLSENEQEKISGGNYF